MNIYIDFDRTLFNTEEFLNDLDNILMSYNINIDTFLEYNKKNNNGFNPYNILKLMEKDYFINKNIYSELDKLLEKSNKYIYNDAYDFLQKVKNKYRVIILTKGNDEFQLKKIRNTNLLDYVNGVLVTLKRKGELDLNYKDSIFIDDNPDELESLLTKNPKRIIRIMRDSGKYNNIKVNDKIEIVDSLKNIFDN